MTFFTKVITKFKFRVFNEIIEKEKLGIVSHGSAFTFFFLCNVVYVIIAWSMVYVEPLAAGSGK